MPRKNCQDTAAQATAYIPVTVVPYTKSGKSRVYCCGEPQILCDNSSCGDVADGGCSYILRQHMCVDIPIRINANAFAGDMYVQ